MNNPQLNEKLITLPTFIGNKIYKTGYTRGADDDQIFQNRVGRNATCLIPFDIWVKFPAVRSVEYEKGFIVLISPAEYFKNTESLSNFGLALGINALIFYERRDEWYTYDPSQYGFTVAGSRTPPLGGEYVARIANTTSEEDSRINHGFTDRLKGAGIRQYEYAPQVVMNQCRLQLEALFWLCADAVQAVQETGIPTDKIISHRQAVLESTSQAGLLNLDALRTSRAVDRENHTICPLCLDKLSASGFMSKITPATGRQRHDLTITEINLFHIEELSYGKFNHRPYNLGWGHHHCNVVCKDSGIQPTLDWMRRVLTKNDQRLSTIIPF